MIRSFPKKKNLKSFVLNFGPQHPAAHGILKISLKMSGEIILKSDSQFGFLHRGTEKLAEQRGFIQSLPYFDRTDYVANLAQEHTYCRSLERLTARHTNTLVKHFRVALDELSRNLNHLLTLSACTLDVGVMGPIFWAFEERERLYEFFERISGARMHTAVHRPFFFEPTFYSYRYLTDLVNFFTKSLRALNGSFLSLLNNRLYKSRFAQVGQISTSRVHYNGITGLMARSSGLPLDNRLLEPVYKKLNIVSFLGIRGDNYDRFVLRVKEYLESSRLVISLVIKYSYQYQGSRPLYMLNNIKLNLILVFKNRFTLQEGWYTLPDILEEDFLRVNKPPTHVPQKRSNIYRYDYVFQTHATTHSSMEKTIQQFKYFSNTPYFNAGLVYEPVESPKGLTWVYVMSSGNTTPYMLKLRSPVSHNMNLIDLLSKGYSLGDFVATFCSLDIVMGELDK